MVKIFTVDEVAGQQVPRAEEYRHAIGILREEYETLVAEDLLYGVLFYGSLFKNNGNDALPGSDIDQICVIARSDDPTIRRLRALRERVEQFRVPTEFHTFDVETVRAGHHGYDGIFLEDLKAHATDEAIIGKNVLDLIEPQGGAEHGAFMDRQIKDLRRLARDVSAPKYGRAHCTFLGRILNYPVGSAKDLVYLRLAGHPTQNGRSLSKHEIAERYEAEFPQADVAPLRDALALRGQYREFFSTTERWDAERYKLLLNEIDSHRRPVQEFIRTNLVLAERMSQNSFIGHSYRAKGA